MGDKEFNELSKASLDKVAGGAHAWKCPQCGSVFIGDATYKCSNCGYEDPNAPKPMFPDNNDDWGGQLKPIDWENFK